MLSLTLVWCALFAFIQVVYSRGGPIPQSARTGRGLNIDRYPNVIDGVRTLTPINGRDETVYDHLDHDEVVYLDAHCAKNKSYAEHLRLELFAEQECFIENEHVSNVTAMGDYFFFFLHWDSSNTDDCADGVVIDFEAFCISMIEYEQIVNVTDYSCDTETVSNWVGLWWMDDIEGDEGDGEYSYPMFDANNLIVYVIDTATNLEHEHFDHIPAANKEYLGTTTDYTGSNHGTHVTGSIVGQYYGVIRDPNVKVKVCDSFPYGSGTTSTVLECLQYVSADLETEKSNNDDVRAVINLSLGSSGCIAYYDSDFAEINDNGGVVFAAGSNDNDDACGYTPACSDYAITVGAYDWSHTRSIFSNYGDCIDAWAPGSSIYSSIFADGSYSTFSGTSMASPIMAGMVGQLLILNSDETVFDTDAIKEIITDDDYCYGISGSDSTISNAFTISCDELSSVASETTTTDPWTDPTTAEPTTTMALYSDPNCTYGLLNSNGTICCPSDCTQCGGQGCRQAGENCCVRAIKSSQISCDSNVAPCVLSTAVTDDAVPSFFWVTVERLQESPLLTVAPFVLMLLLAISCVAYILVRGIMCCMGYRCVRIRRKPKYVKVIMESEAETQFDSDIEAKGLI